MEAEDNHDQMVMDFIEQIASNDGLIANEESMQTLMIALAKSTLHNKSTIPIAAALLKNANKHCEPKLSGRNVRALLLLTDDDTEVDLFVLEAIAAAQGRIMDKNVAQDLFRLVTRAKLTEQRVVEVGQALQTNADKFPLSEGRFTAPDQNDVWEPKMREFLKKIGFVDCSRAVESVEMMHNRNEQPVPRRIVGSMITSLLIETFALELKVPLAERILKLGLLFIEPEDVEMIRSNILCGFFALVNNDCQSLADFLEREILKTSKLAVNQTTLWHMHNVVDESRLTEEQKKQIKNAIDARTESNKSARAQHIKALLLSAELEDKAVVDFILAEINNCKQRILAPSDFETFIKRLAAPGIQSATRLEFITKLMENADL